MGVKGFGHLSWLPNVIGPNESNSDGETSNFARFKTLKRNLFKVLQRLPLRCKCKLIGKSQCASCDAVVTRFGH